MSFRIPLAAIALLLVSATGLAQDAVPLPDVANSKYQIDGVINVDSVYVRSGPGEGYYPTQELTKNAPVTVVGIKFDWLKILPPQGSFSYVGSVFVDRVGDSSVGKINRNDVNIRAGSTVNAMKTTVQTRLNAGDEIEIIGKEEEYLKIKPPAGAYLYVKKDLVTISRPAVAATPAPTPPVQVSPPVAANPSPSETPGAIVTAAPTTAPSPTLSAAAPTTNPSVAVAPSTQPAVAVAPPPTPEELFAKYESAFTEMSKQPLDSQSLGQMISDYQSIAQSDQLSDELKSVVRIRIATLQGRQDNKVKLVEMQRLEKVAADRQLALQAEQEELAERLKASQIQVFVAVGQLQPSSLQIGGGTLYRLVDPSTGRTEIYVRTSDPKITALMSEFVGVNGPTSTDPQLSLRVIEPTEAQPVDESKVNGSVMASIVPPSLLARQAASN
jgi:SH3-like domain-containing protein